MQAVQSASATAPASVRTEDFAPDEILLRRVFTSDERLALSNLILRVLHEYTDANQSSAYALAECRRQLPGLVQDLDAYFSQADVQGRSFFLRLSTLSPKDAYFPLRKNRFFCGGHATDTKDEEEHVVTIEEMLEELSALRVTNTNECLLLLTHSYRVYIDLEWDTVPGGNAFLLMPWRGDEFWHASETRVLVRNGTVVAMSEYYTDLVGGYSNVPTLTTHEGVVAYLSEIVKFVTTLVADGTTPSTSIVVDVALTKTDATDRLQLRMIECNTYDDTFDACLFEDVAEMERAVPIECRWRTEQGTLVSTCLV